MVFKNLMCSLLFIVSQITVMSKAQADIAPSPYVGLSGGANLTAQASYGLGGSGYWGGTQSCPYRTKTSAAAVSMSDEEKEERRKIKKLTSETKLKELARDRAEKKLESLTKKIEKIFASEVSEFLMSVHMDGMKQCNEYRSFPDHQCPAYLISAGTAKPDGEATSKEKIAICEGKVELPILLKDKWIDDKGTGYCSAHSPSSKGTVSSSICSDPKLRVTDGPKYIKISATDCSRSLSEYRKARIENENAAAIVERNKEEVEERSEAVADARERAKLEKEYKMRTQIEGDCEECDRLGRDGIYEKPQRDWWSTAANVVGGLGLAWYGKKIDQSAQEYNAQLGFPSTNSYGYPYVTAGIYSVINGIAGPGAYGCGGGVGGGGFPFGAGGSLSPYGANGYGPYAANGGAFGYPQGLFGSPWGGGMYNPGLGPNGGFAGPNGGWPGGFNGQIGLGIPANGQIGIPAGGGWQTGGWQSAGGFQSAGGWQSPQVMCLQMPCNIGVGGSGQIGIPANGGFQQGGFQVGGFQQGGFQVGGFQQGGFQQAGFQSNPQYQLQLMQQQQAMLQQQAQQQAQLAQYYQAQAQAQMQAYQRQQMVQQQASQVQQEIYSLQMRLQMLVSGAYSGNSGLAGGSGGLYGGGGGGLYGGGSLGGGGFLGGGGAVSGSIYFGAAASGGFNGGYNTGGPGGFNQGIPSGGMATVPGTGTGSRGR